MAGGIGPPRDSTRRALVGTAETESSRTKPWKIWKKAPRALSHPSFGLGPYPVLDNRRSGKQAGRFQDLYAPPRPIAKLQSYRWESHGRSLYQTPIAA